MTFIKGQKSWNKGKKFPKIEIDKKILYKLYIQEQKNTVEISQIMKITISTIRLRLIDYGWKRTKSEALMGHKISQETKEKISNSLKGSIPGNKGMKFEYKPRPWLKSKIPSNVWKKGNIPWNKNKPFMVLEKNPNWKGGKSFEPYHWMFNQRVKNTIKQRDGSVCRNCGLTQQNCLSLLKKGLDIHHIDYDKNNNNLINLITLCTICNSKANFNRNYWTNYYKRMLI